ncbi:hypothetical protein DLE54_09415 [Psychrobacter sp. YP14]|uniref:hypothetical protein n=1 Tax=Psychrobacter sp. YP14 TaxID=2203895 RepID=UPI000D7DCC44|nr:hypothetical protein [Psychrobacter sp. YP14]AWT49700.1 hypothetical protein DLE54_09415 [Psychrobacter sp. YP14]
MSLELKKQSNPFSTGGGGVNFETRVQAAFAISLLTQSFVPCLSKNTRAKELKFQNKYDGVNTDDFVLVASDSFGKESRLYAQIKHEITLSENEDSVFGEVIKSGWKDFKSDDFNPKVDSIALITGQLHKVDINNTLPILEWARYSSSSTDFIKKVNTVGFTSKTKLERLDKFRTQLTRANDGNNVSDDELWQFLKIFHLIGFDLDNEYSVVANLLCSLIECYTEESPSLVLSKIITWVQEFNQNAGVLTQNNISEEVNSLFKTKSKVDFEHDLLKLRERSEYILQAISSSIKETHIDRVAELTQITEGFYDCDFLFVTGARGTGKSGLVKDYIDLKGVDIPVFYLRAEDLDKNHINDVFASMGMKSTLGEIEGYFSLINEKILVIESLEKVLEFDNTSAFTDLLNFINNQTGWKIIATGRDYAYQQLVFTYLQSSGIRFNSINIKGFNQDQLNEVCEQIPQLNSLNNNSALVDIIKIPFFIQIAVVAFSNGADFISGGTEKEFKNVVWSSVIEKQSHRNSGMPLKRRNTFVEVAKQRAKKMVYGLSDRNFDPEAISKLEEDNLINRNESTSLISLTHDVLEDWALERFIEDEYVENSHELSIFFESIGSEPAISRAFRLWLYEKLKYDKSINEFIERVFVSNIESFWKDETIAAILQHDAPEDFLNTLKPQLLRNECELLIRFCFILRITCQRPNPHPRFAGLIKQVDKHDTLTSLFLIPYGQGWKALFDFIYSVRDDLNKVTRKHITEVIKEWCGIINIFDDLPEAAKTVGLLTIWLLEPLKSSYRDEEQRKEIISALLKVAPAIQTEFNELLLQDVLVVKNNPVRLPYVDELVVLALNGLNTPILCKYCPDLVIKLAMHEWLLGEVEEQDLSIYGLSRNIDVEESFGIDEMRGLSPPASGAKGPFKYLLQTDIGKALNFIINLCNITAQKHAESDFSSPSINSEEEIFFSDFFSTEITVREVELILNDGSVVKQYASPLLWKGYRGHSTLPDVLQCALMALENWLIGYLETCSNEDNQIEFIFNHLLRNSNSVLLTSVLASVATGFPEKIGKSSLPLLRTADLYILDFNRKSQERGANELNFFMLQEPMREIYIAERRNAALKPWRGESLETLLFRMQFDNNLRDDAIAVVEQLTNDVVNSDENPLRYMLRRVDTRMMQAVHDKENNIVRFENTTDLPSKMRQEQSELSERLNKSNRISTLQLWSDSLFKEDIFEEKYYSTYQEALIEAKLLLKSFQNREVYDLERIAIEAIATTAAVCVRDNLDSLSDEDKDWCTNIIIDSISTNADNIGACACACAYSLSRLLNLELVDSQREKIELALAKVLTHVNSEVKDHAAKGVRDFLWEIDPKLATNCLAGVVEYARFYKETTPLRRVHHLGEPERRDALSRWTDLIADFRVKLISGRYEINVDDITLTTHSSSLIHLPMLMIPLNNNNPNYMHLMYKIVGFAFESERNLQNLPEDQIIYQNKEIQECLVEHLISSKSEGFKNFKDLLVAGCVEAPSFMYLLKLLFETEMDKQEDFESVWALWSVLSQGVHKIALNDIDDPYMGYQNDLNNLLRSMMFLGYTWTGVEKDISFMKVGAKNLLEFASKYNNNSNVFKGLSALIYNFYDIFFSEGIYILAENLSNNPQLLSKQGDTAFYLEMILGRYLQYEERGVLSRKMYNVCLFLLNSLVETGSARAYYLRENLVRSRRVQ